MAPLQGFTDGFQTQLTASIAQGDTTFSFPTAGMVPGLQYHIRLDDSNPQTTFEYALVQVVDSGTVSVVGGGAGRGLAGTANANHPSGVNSGFVTGVLLGESLNPTFARLDTENLMALASSSGISGQFFNVYGLPGAVQPTRYVGATTGGAPTSGGFLQGDFVLDTNNGVIWLCVTGGSPGVWQNILDGTNTGLTAAVSSLTRWVGATGGGAPAAGTWKQGDVVTDRTGTMWVCTVGGTPGTWVGFPALAAPSSFPQGTLAYSEAIVNQGTFTALTDLNNLAVTVTPGSGRRIRITGRAPASSSTATDGIDMRIREGSSDLMVVDDVGNATDSTVNLIAMVYLQPTNASHTYKLSMERRAGAGNVTMSASSTNKAFIVVEDVGV